MAFDQQKLRQFYLTQGYADFRVVSAVAELTPDKKDFIITYVVEEGQRYKFGDVKVESQLRDFDEGVLTNSLASTDGGEGAVIELWPSLAPAQRSSATRSAPTKRPSGPAGAPARRATSVRCRCRGARTRARVRRPPRAPAPGTGRRSIA